MEDLRQVAVRDRLRAIWLTPLALDPARQSAHVTRAVALRLATVSRALEQNHDPEDVALFLMRCLFTMFAEDVDLLPARSFRDLLARCEKEPKKLQPLLGQLWEAMDGGGFAYGIEATVRRFNGEFFKRRTVLPLQADQITLLREAAEADWREVEPAIFGTLVEQALSQRERAKLGAHYTPRAYVERLVVATVIEPLRVDWATVLSTAERQKVEGRGKDAVATVRAFHDRLCATRILDPACGTGNFLYVALELVKRLEGEVLEALNDLGGQESLSGLEGSTVDPHQFLGLELNPRAAAIAELVLWIGHLQWHFRTRGAAPSEPILKAFRNIRGGYDAVLTAEKKPIENEDGGTLTRPEQSGQPIPAYVYRNPKRPDWPSAEFIIGNPPFIGGKDIRSTLGEAYATALWAAHPRMNESADFVMYWWDHAAELLAAKGTVLRRFGFVTTNSISQVFQRRVMERHFDAKTPISLTMVVADHPWTKATKDAAAVRIAMTVAVAGRGEGVLHEVIREADLNTDHPTVELNERYGTINSDLTVGADVTKATQLRANQGLSSPGVKLHGSGFIVAPSKASSLGLGSRPGLERYIRPYRNGRDLTAKSRDALVIDFFGLSSEVVRAQYPEAYQHLKLEVKEKTIVNKKGETELVGRDWNPRDSYKDLWWIFGEPRKDLRPALADLSRYIVTVETMRHRVFQFLDASIVPDNKLIVLASADAFHLGVLSSRTHVVWSLRAGGWLGVGNDSVYVKSQCFDPFPFPDANREQAERIRKAADSLDAHRKERRALHPKVSLTDAYNVLAKIRSGIKPSSLNQSDQIIFDAALVLVLRELHDELDAAVAEAYNCPVDLPEEDLLTRLLNLNRARAAEEVRGEVRWLRPDYQIPIFSRAGGQAGEQFEANLGLTTEEARKASFPSDDVAQTAAVMAALALVPGPLSSSMVAAGFKRSKTVEPRVTAVLSALARLGFVATNDSGKSFALRRAA